MTSPVAILGLGLIGGSLARDLAGLGRRVIGYDADDRAIDAALSHGILADRLGPDLEGIENAEIIVIATPVLTALDSLEAVAGRADPAAILTDVGSTKAAICARADDLGLGCRFVGSHPLAGDHRSGWSVARTGLFEQAAVFVCPTAKSSDEAIDAVLRLWKDVGASVQIEDPVNHDRRMAAASHLPQIVASAVAATLASTGTPPYALGTGGRDVTRLAASSPGMWSGIALTNADHILATIQELQDRLSSFSAALRDADVESVQAFFEQGNRWSRTGSGEE